MLKIMLADMDVENVNSFRMFIKKKFVNFEIVKPALMSNEFLKNIEQYQPDVVILEMRFFGSSTFKSIRDLSSSHPEIKLILYGSITESEYMKKALDYNAVAYMYRPVKPSELERCLKEVVKSFAKEKVINEENNELLVEYQEQLFFFENKFFSAIVHGHLKDEFEISSSLDYFDISISPLYTVALLRIDHFKKFVLALDEREKHITIFKILKLINSMIVNGKAFINTFNEICLIIGGIEDFDEIIKILNDIKNEIKLKMDIGVSFGVGRTYENLSNIKISYNEAVAALRYRCIIGYNSVISIDFVEPKNRITYSYPIEREELLVYTSVIGEYNYSLRLVDELFDALVAAGSIPKTLVSQIVMDILISIIRNAVEQDLNVKSLYKYFPANAIMRLNDIEEAREFMKKGLKKFCDAVNEMRKDMESEMYDTAIEYINEKYFENINNSKMAQMLNCSVTYFNRMFIEHSGKNLNDYLNRKRIDEAKNLIILTDLDDELIAIKIGYNDVNTFKSYFKQLEGYMVADFRFIKKKSKNK